MSPLCAYVSIALLCGPPPVEGVFAFRDAREAHEVRLPDMAAYGIADVARLCQAPQGQVDADNPVLWRAACPPPGSDGGTEDLSRGDALLGLAHLRLLAAHGMAPEPLAAEMRVINGLVVAGFTAGSAVQRPAEFADRYGRVAEAAIDGRLFALASELWLADVAFCPPKDDTCHDDDIFFAAQSLVDAGRQLNDVERLRQAGQMAETLEASGRLNAADLLETRNVAGRAYSDAAAFAEPNERKPFMDRSIAAFERALPQANATAPSFATTMIWHNLGAAYVDRGVLMKDAADFERGVAYYERSLPVFEARKDRAALARTRSNMARAMSRMARAHLDLAEHDRAIASERAAIAGYEEGQEAFNAGFAYYRLAQDLTDKAWTADRLAAALPPDQDGRRAELKAMAASGRTEALALLQRAKSVFVTAAARQNLDRAEELEAQINAGRASD